MADRTFASLADGGGFFEGPRWRDGRWWVSDFYRHAVFAIDPDGTTEQVMTVEAQPSGLGWMPDGSLLVVSMKDHRVLRRAPDGTVTIHAEIGEHCGGLANDIIVAADGRAWVGNFGFDLMAGEPPRRWCGSTPTARRPWPPVPDGLGVYACMLGGDDGRTLLACCAPDFDEHRRASERAAVLLTTTVDVPHAGLP